MFLHIANDLCRTYPQRLVDCWTVLVNTYMMQGVEPYSTEDAFVGELWRVGSHIDGAQASPDELAEAH
jgi:hypothetical protein